MNGRMQTKLAIIMTPNIFLRDSFRINIAVRSHGNKSSSLKLALTLDHSEFSFDFRLGSQFLFLRVMDIIILELFLMISKSATRAPMEKNQESRIQKHLIKWNSSAR